jgi:hypothetical protein
MLLLEEIRKLSYPGTGLGDLDSTVSSEVSDAAGELALPFTLSFMFATLYQIRRQEVYLIEDDDSGAKRRQQQVGGRREDKQCGVVRSCLHLHG